MNSEKELEDKILLFLINFFDGNGLALRYPWYIFCKNKKTTEDVRTAWERFNKKDGNFQLYLHTLFCESKCLYCNCISYVEKDNKRFDSYKNYLISRLDFYSSVVKKNINSVYFGGGTFSLWSYEQMEEILDSINQRFDFNQGYNWIVEVHPNSITKEKLRLLKEKGVTDIMLGTQTTNDRLNHLNNRISDSQKINQAIENIMENNFDKLCLDIMYNLPFETEEQLLEDLKFLSRIKNKYENRRINIELNNRNLSYIVPFINYIYKNYESFSSFVKEFNKKSTRMNKIVQKFVEKEFVDFFEVEREEIQERKSSNTSIAGVGYGAISYIPGEIFYAEDIGDYNFRGWGEDTNIIGYNLSDKDNTYFIFLNNLRRGVKKSLFKEIIKLNPYIKDVINYYKNYFFIGEDTVMLKSGGDLIVDLIALNFYDSEKRKFVFKDLIKKRKKVGSIEELKNNIDMYLNIYYNKNYIF